MIEIQRAKLLCTHNQGNLSIGKTVIGINSGLRICEKSEFVFRQNMWRAYLVSSLVIIVTGIVLLY